MKTLIVGFILLSVIAIVYNYTMKHRIGKDHYDKT